MIRRLLLAVVISLSLSVANYSFAQIITRDTVTWKFFCVQVEENEYQVFLEAYIAKGYRLYSMDQLFGSNAFRPEISFDKNIYVHSYEKVLEMGNLIKNIDKPRGVLSNYYEDSVIFTYQVKLMPTIVFKLLQKDVSPKKVKPVVLTGIITYQVGNDYMEYPPKQKQFSILVWPALQIALL